MRRTVRLINQSDGLLQYGLECQVLLPEPQPVVVTTNDGDSAVQREEQAREEADAPPVELFLAAAGGDAMRQQEAWVDEPQGVLAARCEQQSVGSVCMRGGGGEGGYVCTPLRSQDKV